VIADALPIADIEQLQGNSTDLNNPAYTRLKERLEVIRRDNHDLRFVYLMGQDQKKGVYFYADSEVPTSGAYSPPGQAYEQATVRDVSAFGSDQAFVEGPARDQWGLWMSGIAPIVDQQSGRILAVTGVDTPALTFFFQVFTYAIIPIILAAIPFAGLARDRKLASKEHEISQLKDQFVSIASHELRSPLNGMLWAIQSLLKTGKNLTHEQNEMLSDMYKSTSSSIATINEILDLSIFERGEADKMQHDKVDMVSVVSDVVKTLKLGASEKRIAILEHDFPEHAYVMGDLSALKRALMNVLANSIKYSPDLGTITITYKAEPGLHRIAIADEGIGIPEKEQSKVFGGYYRASNAVKVEAMGTGLGLWLTKLMTEQHHGRVWLKSEENKGTTIFIELPDSASRGQSKPARQ
jgi:signal transduction histidine kinase